MTSLRTSLKVKNFYRNEVLYQFYPEVYPFNLWIYVGKDVSGMVECFNNDFSYVYNSKAVTVSVPYGGCKLNPNTGFLIWFINKKIIDFETVCHEASHVSTEAFNFLGEEVKTQNHSRISMDG